MSSTQYPETTLSPKVTAGGTSGAAVILIVWLSETFTAVDVPQYVAMAAVVLVAAGAAWLKSDPLRRPKPEAPVALDLDEGV